MSPSSPEGCGASTAIVDPVEPTVVVPPFSEGVIVDSAAGDLDGDGADEVLVSYRHALRTYSHSQGPPLPTDCTGMSAHLGVTDTDGTPLWLSRRPPHPIGSVVACDRTAAFAYTELDDDAIVATAVGTWSGFGFVLEDELAGSGRIGCADVDGDGLLDPVVLDR